MKDCKMVLNPSCSVGELVFLLGKIWPLEKLITPCMTSYFMEYEGKEIFIKLLFKNLKRLIENNLL
jgi:hypothetical protein